MANVIFQTDRLSVEQYSPTDEDHFFRLNSDQLVMRYIRLISDRDESKHFLLQNIKGYDKNPMTGRWAVRARDDGRFVGTFAILPMEQSNDWHVGYALLAPEWGKGFATELVDTGISYAFRKMLLPRLMAIVEQDNERSVNVLRKMGFRQVQNIHQEGKDLFRFELVNPAVIETERLLIAALDLEQFENYIKAGNELERALGLREGHRIVSEALLEMIEQFSLPAMQKADGDNYYFFTLWIVVDKSANQLVAELGFKGIPNTRGEVEIGYSTFPAFQQRGYMTEAVGALCDWCAGKAGIKSVTGETKTDNEPSQRVLQRNGFTLVSKRDNMLIWSKTI
ncbi:MAG: N-acetyltransferase [Chitinophagaceae bacterium]|nr:MAG: N-acetyltransferase [Chitinophagaceae bacterium]